MKRLPLLCHATRDEQSLLAVLGLNYSGNHNRCRFCGNLKALSVFESESGWRFNCHHCGKAGSLIDALAYSEGIPVPEVLRKFNLQSRRKVRKAQRPTAEPVPPTQDHERIFRLSEAALTSVFVGFADRYLSERGISKGFIFQMPILGFVVKAQIREWQYPIERSWIIRVCTPDGICVGLKGHREHPPTWLNKNFWLPFGLEPAAKPKHGFSTLWPCPEWFDQSETVHLVEGELKAAALLSAGLSATAPTTGTDFRWTQGAVARMAGRRVVILYDDDEDGAGFKFRDSSISALRRAVSSLRSTTFGRMPAEVAHV